MNTIPFEIKLRGGEDEIKKLVDDFRGSRNDPRSIFSPINEYKGMNEDGEGRYRCISVDVYEICTNSISSKWLSNHSSKWLSDHSTEWLKKIKEQYPKLEISIFWYYIDDETCIGYIGKDGKKYIISEISELEKALKMLARKH